MTAKVSASMSSTSLVPPSGGSDSWELVILDSVPPHSTETGCTAVADLDGDGKTEVVIAANGALLWYRPSSYEKGVIARGHFGGAAIDDIDGDGRKEVVAARTGGRLQGFPEKWGIYWYKSGANLHDSWSEHIVDIVTTGHLTTSYLVMWMVTDGSKWWPMPCIVTSRD